jgi:hypothetical protein
MDTCNGLKKILKVKNTLGKFWPKLFPPVFRKNISVLKKFLFPFGIKQREDWKKSNNIGKCLGLLLLHYSWANRTKKTKQPSKFSNMSKIVKPIQNPKLLLLYEDNHIWSTQKKHLIWNPFCPGTLKMWHFVPVFLRCFLVNILPIFKFFFFFLSQKTL